MVEDLKEHLNDLIKIELEGDTDPFPIYRGRHPEPGPDGYPWEKSQTEMFEKRISLFEGLNRYTEPETKWYDHYILEETNYEKICDLLMFFDFGLDNFIDPDTGALLNSNDQGKMRQRRDAGAQFLRHFRTATTSILSLTSQFLIFAVRHTEMNASLRSHLAEAVWNHNKIYYPRPRQVIVGDERYSLETIRGLGVDQGVFTIGWDDC